jgi:hypothetical protein
MTDLTAVNPIFGNGAVLLAGIRPDGLPQVSVILRNHGDDPVVLPMHHLPTIGNPGEAYARVGNYDGVLLVFEAASATIVPFIDTNGDGNPETRAPAMVTFPQPRVPFIKEFQPLGASNAPGVLAFGGVVVPSTGETDGVIYHQGSLIPGRVRVRTATAPHPLSRFLLPPEAGMRSFSISAPVQSTIQIERSDPQFDNGSFHAFGPPLVVTSSLAHETLPTGTPLVAGDSVRIVTNGVAGSPVRVAATSRPLIYSHWPQEAISQGIPFSLTGRP